MNNLLLYDEFLNENIFTDIKGGFKNIKNKLINAWDKLDFQKREEFTRKFFKYSLYGSLSLSILFILLGACQLLKIADVNEFYKDHKFIYYIITNMWWILGFNFALKNARGKMIRRKMSEIKQRISKYEFGDYVYVVIGNKSNIDKYIKRLKDDELIDDGHLANIDGAIIIDFGGAIKDNIKTKEEVENIIKQHSSVDPYGEEEWDDNSPVENINKYDKENNIRKRMGISDFATETYSVRLRKINSVTSYLDFKLLNKTKKKDAVKAEEDYKKGLNFFKNPEPVLKSKKYNVISHNPDTGVSTIELGDNQDWGDFDGEWEENK